MGKSEAPRQQRCNNHKLSPRSYRQMTTTQPGQARFEGLIRVAVARLCKFQSAEEVASMLRSIASDLSRRSPERIA